MEHTNTLTSQAARVALLQFLHFIYHTTDTTFASREVEYIAAMTSAILDYDNIVGVDERTYKYLMDMLTPVAEQTDTDYAVEYATEPLGFAWETFDTNLYTPPIRDAIAVGANRTFGSTEFNTLSEASRTLLINQKQNGTGAGGWTSFAPFESEPFITSVGAPDGVFLMTPAQFNYAQDLS